jgi:hypothetical protein
MKKHMILMLIGCLVPLLLIFLLPLFGISGKFSTFIFIAAMFACHLLMPMHRGSHEQHSQNKLNKREENHASH